MIYNNNQEINNREKIEQLVNYQNNSKIAAQLTGIFMKVSLCKESTLTLFLDLCNSPWHDAMLQHQLQLLDPVMTDDRPFLVNRCLEIARICGLEN